MGRVADSATNSPFERASRRGAAGPPLSGLLVLLLVLALGVRADDLRPSGEAKSYKAQIVDVANRKLRTLGKDPRQYAVRVLDRVDDSSRYFLGAHRIDPRGIWVVELVPRSETGPVGFGGGFQFYFRHPSISIVLKTAEQ